MSKIKQQQYLGLILLVFLGLVKLHASPKGNVTDKLYHQALEELQAMLEGTKELSFKEAVYWVENAYLDGELSYEKYNDQLHSLVSVCKLAAQQYQSTYAYEDSSNIKINYAVARTLMDSVLLHWKTDSLYLLPASYDFEDFTGAKDWTKMFVSKLLDEGTGNCHSLPYLYKILVEELGGSAALALAPHHIYIKTPTKDTRIGWYNTELTNGSHPTDAWIIASGYISLEAIQNGLYMEPLSEQASLALCVLDLAQGYAKKFPSLKNDFVLNCLDLVLHYYPNCVNALLFKAEVLYQKNGVSKEVNTLCQQLIDFGYDQMPPAMYLDWLTRSPYKTKEAATAAPYQEEQDNPFMNHQNTSTLSKGRYVEFHAPKKEARIGQLVFNTIQQSVVDYKEHSLVEPTTVSRFLSIDPLSPEYPELTPYQFASNTPIQAIDLDGLEAFFIHGTASHPGRWLKKSVVFLMGITNNKTKNVEFAWKAPLTNGLKRRQEAAQELADHVLANRKEGEEITLIGHSHGGNVAILAAKLIYKETGEKVNLITIATPVYEKGKNGKEKAEDPNNPANVEAINDHIHLYNKKDGVSGVWAGKKSRHYSNETSKQYGIDSKKGGHSFVNKALEEVKKLEIEKLSKVMEGDSKQGQETPKDDKH